MRPHGRLRCPRALLVITLAAAATHSGVAAPRAPEPRVVEVVARRFVFEPAVIEAVVGEPLRLLVRSGDGLHGFEIKKLKINKDIPRGGEPVVITFTPARAGQFEIVCSEYCGDDHDRMKGTLIVSARGENGAPR